MVNSKIGWCDDTFNPISGCLHGCEYCYARDIAHRFGGWTDSDGDTHHDEILKNESKVRELDEPLRVFREGQTIFSGKWQKAPYPYDFIPTFHRYRLNDYIGKKGRNIFVCSMADLFGKWVPDEWIKEVFDACEKAPQHNYLFLTKNPGRYERVIEANFKKVTDGNADNFWFGTTVTNDADLLNRGADLFVSTVMNYDKGRFKRFLSIEPLLEQVTKLQCLKRHHWIIVGAETGRRKDKVVPERKWIEDIVVECKNDEIPIFMKSSLADIWGEPLIQEFPEGLERKES